MLCAGLEHTVCNSRSILIWTLSRCISSYVKPFLLLCLVVSKECKLITKATIRSSIDFLDDNEVKYWHFFGSVITAQLVILQYYIPHIYDKAMTNVWWFHWVTQSVQVKAWNMLKKNKLWKVPDTHIKISPLCLQWTITMTPTDRPELSLVLVNHVRDYGLRPPHLTDSVL